MAEEWHGTIFHPSLTLKPANDQGQLILSFRAYVQAAGEKDVALIFYKEQITPGRLDNFLKMYPYGSVDLVKFFNEMIKPKVPELLKAPETFKFSIEEMERTENQ